MLKSNGLRRQKIRLKKFGFSSKTVPANIVQKVTVTTLFQTVPHRIFQLLAQTAHACFCGRKWVHTRLRQQDRTQRLTRRKRGLPSLVHSVVLCCRRYPFYSAMLLYTYISRFSVNPHYRQQLYLRPSFIVFFNFSHKRPTFAFAGKSEYTLGFAQRIAHNGSHAEIGAFRMGGGITTLGAFRTFTNIPGPGVRTANFAAFGSWPGGLPKNAESLRDSDALMRVAAPRRRCPAGLRSPAVVHSACLAALERLDQVLRQSYGGGRPGGQRHHLIEG